MVGKMAAARTCRRFRDPALSARVRSAAEPRELLTRGRGQGRVSASP